MNSMSANLDPSSLAIPLWPYVRFAAALVPNEPANTDPIFAAIERAKTADAASLALYEREPVDGDTPEYKAKEEENVGECWAARAALARTVATTPAGLVALTSFIHAQSVDLREFYFDDNDPLEDFAASLDASVRGVIGQFVMPAIDPVFAAIEAHRKALAELTAHNKTEPEVSDPGYDAWESLTDELVDAWSEANKTMLKTVPTTRAGAVALIDAAFSRGKEFRLDATAHVAECDVSPLLIALRAVILNLV